MNSPHLRAWKGKERDGEVTEAAAAAVRECSPPDARPERPMSERFLPDTTAGVRAEREDQGAPAADVDSPEETQGCSAASSGAPGGSDLPSIAASEHASTHAHARTELPLATAAEPRKP